MREPTDNRADDVRARVRAFTGRLDLSIHTISHIIIPKLVDIAFIDFFNRNWELGLPQWYVRFVKKHFSSCIGYVEVVDEGWMP